MQYPDLVWTVLGVIGGFLLLNESSLTRRNKAGVGLIFSSFLFQVYWRTTNPWSDSSLVQVIFVTVYLLITLPLLVWPGWLRKRISK